MVRTLLNAYSQYASCGAYVGLPLVLTLPRPVLFTVSNLVISREFPPELQSLAGGVFGEVSQFGNSVGLAITAAIAASVTEHSGGTRDDVDALMEGYRGAFWTIFASCATVTVVAWFGLKRGGIVGKKDD